MKAYNLGQRDLRLPRILGHEIAGTVAETGKCVNQVKAGDRVQVAPGIPCGACTYCLQGLHHLCDSVCTMGFHCNGGFAEYVLVPERGVRHGALNIIPEHLSFQEAALTEPLACTVNLQDALAVQVGDAVVVFGAGPLGIINARLARARGAGTVILVEINEARLESAPPRDFDHRINALKKDPLKKVLEITGGRGADAVIPCCPDPSVFKAGLAMLAKRGRFGFFQRIGPKPAGLESRFEPHSLQRTEGLRGIRVLSLP
jgi:L-iditol 2-dehydrogenase